MEKLKSVVLIALRQNSHVKFTKMLPHLARLSSINVFINGHCVLKKWIVFDNKQNIFNKKL